MKVEFRESEIVKAYITDSDVRQRREGTNPMPHFRSTGFQIRTLPEETYSLTDQILRSLRSVATNIAEGFRKRRYPNHFISKLTDCDAEASETQVCLDFAHDCGYLARENRDRLASGYEEVGKMLAGMMANPEKVLVS